MRKVIATFFLFAIVMSSTIGLELAKLPVLLHHYVEHSQSEHSLSFIDYLAEHYVSNINHPDGKHQDHERLPFKSADHCCAHTMSFVSAQSPQVIVPEANQLSTQKIIFQHNSYVGAFLDGIWQPPRFV